MGYRIIVETQVLELGFRSKGHNYHVVAETVSAPSQDVADLLGTEWCIAQRLAEQQEAAAREERGDAQEEWSVEMFVRTHIVPPGCLTPEEQMDQEIHDWVAAEARRSVEAAERAVQRWREFLEEQDDLLEHELHGERLRWEGKR
jgi:hypothetical protein